MAASQAPAPVPTAGFAERLAELSFASELCDGVVLCEGAADGCERLPVVRAVLAAASPEIERQFRSSGKEVRLPVTAAALRCAIAHCCAGGSGAVGAEGHLLEACPVEELQRAAEVLSLPGLEAWCKRVLRARSVAGKQGPPATDPAAGSATVALWLGSAAIVLISVWAWAPSLQYKIENNGFFMDDRMIAKNANVYEEVDWPRLFRTDYWGLEMFQGSWTHKSFRPLAVLTFRWNYMLHGFDSTGFHVTNVALHFAASLLLGAFGTLALGLPSAWGALLCALFLAHPVHTESVLYIVGRADILCCAMLLLASLLYGPCLVRRPPPLPVALLLLALASALLVLAGLCKETGFCFFGLLVGWELLAKLVPRTPGRSRALCSFWIRLLMLLVVGGGACYWRIWYTAGTEIERMDPHSNPVAVESERSVRVLSYALLHGIYAQLLVWPSFLCYDYSFDAIPLVRAPSDARLLLPIAAYLAFFLLLCLSLQVLRPPRSSSASSAQWLSRSRVREAPIVGLAMLVLSFFPMSNVVFPVGTMIGERLLYIPSAGLLLCFVGLGHLWQLDSSLGRGGGLARHLPAALLVLSGLAGAVLCANRVVDWSSPEAITVADGLKQLRSGRVQFNHANVHLQAKRYEEALATYERCIAIDPADRDSLPLFHAGQILIYQGRHKEAVNYLSRAVSGYFSPLTMAEEEIWHDFALALWFTQDAVAAVQNFWNALTVNPLHTKSLNNLGCAQGLGAAFGLLPSESLRSGVESLRNAIHLDQTNALYWRNIVALLRMAGDEGAANEAWMHLQAVFPSAAVGEPPSDCSWEFNFR